MGIQVVESRYLRKTCQWSYLSCNSFYSLTCYRAFRPIERLAGAAHTEDRRLLQFPGERLFNRFEQFQFSASIKCRYPSSSSP